MNPLFLTRSNIKYNQNETNSTACLERRRKQSQRNPDDTAFLTFSTPLIGHDEWFIQNPMHSSRHEAIFLPLKIKEFSDPPNIQKSSINLLQSLSNCKPRSTNSPNQTCNNFIFNFAYFPSHQIFIFICG